MAYLYRLKIDRRYGFHYYKDPVTGQITVIKNAEQIVVPDPVCLKGVLDKFDLIDSDYEEKNETKTVKTLKEPLPDFDPDEDDDRSVPYEREDTEQNEKIVDEMEQAIRDKDRNVLPEFEVKHRGHGKYDIWDKTAERWFSSKFGDRKTINLLLKQLKDGQK